MCIDKLHVADLTENVGGSCIIPLVYIVGYYGVFYDWLIDSVATPMFRMYRLVVKNAKTIQVKLPAPLLPQLYNQVVVPVASNRQSYSHQVPSPAYWTDAQWGLKREKLHQQQLPLVAHPVANLSLSQQSRR